MKIEQMRVRCKEAMLYAELYIPDSVPAPCLLICHGLNAKGSKGLRLYAKLAETACKQGFACLVFDFRGVGRSTGVFDYGVGEQQDVKCAIEYLASRPEVLGNRVFVVGHSLGGAVSLYALRGDARVKGLVLWSTPKNHNYNVKKFLRNTRGTLGLYVFLFLSYIDRLLNVQRILKLEVYGVRLRPRHVREKLMKLDECYAVSRLHIPLLVMVGSKDDIVGVDEAEAIYSSASEPKTLVVIEGADHVYRGKERQLVDETLEWIKKLAFASEK
ncbi:MAG: alpha/beta fold hydrolase [Candidatus Bathyarchaeia archaeon]